MFRVLVWSCFNPHRRAGFFSALRHISPLHPDVSILHPLIVPTSLSLIQTAVAIKPTEQRRRAVFSLYPQVADIITPPVSDWAEARVKPGRPI